MATTFGRYESMYTEINTRLGLFGEDCLPTESSNIVLTRFATRDTGTALQMTVGGHYVLLNHETALQMAADIQDYLNGVK